MSEVEVLYRTWTRGEWWSSDDRLVVVENKCKNVTRLTRGTKVGTEEYRRFHYDDFVPCSVGRRTFRRSQKGEGGLISGRKVTDVRVH